ncbi:hypothetical protein GCM10023187_07090 [Nibrella viscosa]|uniref:Dolichyl-phosphate-mannose-protein mannosyltransferase n=2 Tax=Nibrella viscosa TaxID=1084524 RepID=A0ABP8JXH3_9BACT
MAVLVAVNPTHFTSIDSGYYLQSAENLLDGRGYVVLEDGHYTWNGVFPIGYSGLIALFSFITSLPVLLSSKVINWLAIGISTWLWYKRLGAVRTGWLLSIWLLGSFLRIATYTWSETVFLVLLAEVVWAFHQQLAHPSIRHTLILLVLGLLLFGVRYVGGYIFGLLGAIALGHQLWPQKVFSWLGGSLPQTAGNRLTLVTISGLVGMGFYFWLNSRFTDSPYGGERFHEAETGGSLLPLFLLALVNEVLLIRDFISDESNTLAWIGVGIQVTWLLALINVFKRIPPAAGSRDTQRLQKLLVSFGGLYLIILFALRIFSPFAGPTARLMAPFTFCMLFAAMLWLTEPGRQLWEKTFRPFWIVLLVCSWLQLFPQVDVSRKLRQVQQQFFSPSIP